MPPIFRRNTRTFAIAYYRYCHSLCVGGLKLYIRTSLPSIKIFVGNSNCASLKYELMEDHIRRITYSGQQGKQKGVQQKNGGSKCRYDIMESREKRKSGLSNAINLLVTLQDRWAGHSFSLTRGT